MSEENSNSIYKVSNTFDVDPENKYFDPLNGFLINKDVPIARGGIYEYKGFELGRPNQPKITAYRPLSTYTPEILEQFRKLPATLGHPREDVSAKNAKELMVGILSDMPAVIKGKDIKAPDITVWASNAIDAIEKQNKKAVSIAFMAFYDFIPGVSPEGVPYDTTEKLISLNHIAVGIEKGKAGYFYSLNEETEETNNMTVKRTYNGITIDFSEQAAEAWDAREKDISAIVKCKNEEEEKKEKVEEKEESSEKVMNAINALTQTVTNLAKVVNESLEKKEEEGSEDGDKGQKKSAENEGFKTETDQLETDKSGTKFTSKNSASEKSTALAQELAASKKSVVNRVNNQEFDDKSQAVSLSQKLINGEF